MKLFVQATIILALALAPFAVMADDHGHSHGEEATSDMAEEGEAMEAADAGHAEKGKKKADAKKKVAKKAKKAKAKKTEKM